MLLFTTLLNYNNITSSSRSSRIFIRFATCTYYCCSISTCLKFSWNTIIRPSYSTFLVSSSAIRMTSSTSSSSSTTTIPESWNVLQTYERRPLLPNIVIVQGSVVDFTCDNKNGAIVNAANEVCLGGGGVDGAITAAGGPLLAQHRLQLPKFKKCNKRKLQNIEKEEDDEDENKNNENNDNNNNDNNDTSKSTDICMGKSTNKDDSIVDHPSDEDDNDIKMNGNDNNINNSNDKNVDNDGNDDNKDISKSANNEKSDEVDDSNIIKDHDEDDNNDDDDDTDISYVRCPTGNAVITGPGKYGELGVNYVIHAVGPNYWNYNDNVNVGHGLLKSAYTESLNVAEVNKINDIAFCLLSAGIFRGSVPLQTILQIAIQTIIEWKPNNNNINQQQQQQQQSVIENIYVCGFSEKESKLLLDIANNQVSSSKSPNNNNEEEKERN